MVAIRSRSMRDLRGNGRGTAVVFLLAVGVMTALTVVWVSDANESVRRVVSETNSLLALQEKLIPFDHDVNAAAVKWWRRNVLAKCAAAVSKSDVLAVGGINKVGFTMPLARVQQPRDDDAVKKCKFVVMDFGANVGDTSGHVVDAGFPGCKRTDIDGKNFVVEPHFNLDTKQFQDPKSRNPLTANLAHLMKGFGPETGPEDYCYYGVEGNPVFTDRLRELEDYIMGIRPRPIRHMHFFTESVGSGVDGMTKLYLDTVNTKQNFWGSSIFSGHQDVRKSAEKANAHAETIAAPVKGYTIGTLMRKTLKAFDPAATEQDKKGGHFLLKVDIEGGEFPLLDQAAKEGTLCEYIKMGNQADLFIEYHSKRVTGAHNYKKSEFEKTLKECGVNFRPLAAWWA